MHLSTCWKGEKCLPAVALGAFLDCQLATGNGGWQCTGRRSTGRRSRGCGSFYGCFEAWLHMQLHFTAATKLITNRNARKKRRKTSFPLPKSQMQSVVGTMRCREGIQQILSIRFRYGFSSPSSCFFFTFFSDYFFPVCFLSLHNKSLRKAFQFKWMKKKANVLCMQPTAAAVARAGWVTHRERGEGRGKQSKQSVNDALKWSRKGSWLLDFHDSLEHSKSLGNWSNK